ncbi:hypothetical protein PPGU19_011830 [Paraburkholderia sp. PGU19]|uniref:hypothetical protein n=1 Tax=Paraburkholderia sp. PGU19 TaxID=2735434 RepID=UPI0015DA21C9|nr:hypothetical protein [Paraburkholderia sp. PGU19]BCF96614.1 hypothetical protein PPGU19_011830 [Paraburkholderia sp. PGU19]
MKRSAPLQRRTPLARGSGFKRKEPKPFALADRKTLERHTAMKRRVKRVTVAEGKRFIDACRGEECYLRVSGICQALGWGSETVVPCHSNQSRHGKAGALKAEHRYTVPGCGPCHAWIDQNTVGTPRQVKFDVWDRAYERWEPVRARKLGIELQEAA